jgi:hypothetical protein
MLEWYVIAVIGFSLAFDQHRTLITSQAAFPSIRLIHILFDLSAWFGGIATLLILLLGFFIGTWWWPLCAMGFGTAVNYCGRLVVPLKYRWMTSLASILVGIGSIIILLTGLL